MSREWNINKLSLWSAIVLPLGLLSVACDPNIRVKTKVSATPFFTVGQVDAANLGDGVGSQDDPIRFTITDGVEGRIRLSIAEVVKPEHRNITCDRLPLWITLDPSLPALLLAPEQKHVATGYQFSCQLADQPTLDKAGIIRYFEADITDVNYPPRIDLTVQSNTGTLNGKGSSEEPYKMRIERGKQFVSMSFDVSDKDGDSTSVVCDPKPDWLSYDELSGEIRIQPQEVDDLGAMEFSCTGSDGLESSEGSVHFEVELFEADTETGITGGTSGRSKAKPARFVVTTPPEDFTTDDATTVMIETRLTNNKLAANDDSSVIRFTPTGCGKVTNVFKGDGDGRYSQNGVEESVVVDGGKATISLGCTTVGAFRLTMASDGLVAPAPMKIKVSPGKPAAIIVAKEAQDFAAGSSTDITFHVLDAHDNLVTTDSRTRIAFSPTVNAAIAGIVTGTGDGSYGDVSTIETMTVSGGIATISLSSTVAGPSGMTVSSTGLTTPMDSSVNVSPSVASQVVLTTAGEDFDTIGSATLTVEVQDEFGNLVESDSSTNITFTPTGDGAIAGVVTGSGDGSYGTSATPEVVTVTDGVASVNVNNPTAQTFTVSITNDSGLTNPSADSISVTQAPATQVVVTSVPSDFDADNTTTITIEVQDGGGNVMVADDATLITFTPTGSAVVAGVTTGDGDDTYGTGAETIAVEDGVVTITLANTVAETFSVAISNNAGLTDPSDQVINVTAGTPTQVIVTSEGTDFSTNTTTDLSVVVADAHGNTIITDTATEISFSPSGSAKVSGVVTGSGDDTYNGGTEVVTVNSGVATVTLSDLAIETFTVSMTNNAGLANPGDDSINVSLGPPHKVVVTSPGSDFSILSSTTLTVEVQDIGSNTVVSDSTTQITFTPDSAAVVSNVDVGSGDTSYGTGAETVTVAAGVATIALEDTTVQTFGVAITNDGGLVNPLDDSINATPPVPSQVVITSEGADFTTDETTTLTVAVQDAAGNTDFTDMSTVITFTTSGSAVISDVNTGDGDDTYGSGVEAVTVSAGVATVTLANTMAELFTVAIDNSGGFADPADDSINVSLGNPAKMVITSAGVDFDTDNSTTLTVAVQDASGNTITTDSSTLITFTPSGSAVVSDVITGDGDDTYGTGSEVVTVAAGVASVTLADTTAETFTVAIDNSAGLTDPSDDSITVSPGAPNKVVIISEGTDFDTDSTTTLSVAVQDINGNTVTADSTTTITFTPSGTGMVTDVNVGDGDDDYGNGAETVTVASGLATVTIGNTTVESFSIAVTNGAGLIDPADDSINVSVGAPAQVGITSEGSDFTILGSTTLTVAVQDAGGNTITADSSTAITFTPSNNAVVSGVVTGDGDDDYGNAGAEIVTVASGVATISLEDSTVESFTVAIANNAGLTNPPNDNIDVTPAVPTQVVITSEGADFDTDGFTTLTVAIQDAGGNTIVSDSSTLITFTPTGSAVISGVATGSGDDNYGNPGAEIVTVNAGVASVTLADSKVETFTVDIADNAGLTDPPDDSINVTVGAATAVVIATEGTDFTTDSSTTLTVEVHDGGGNVVTTDSTTQITFTPSGATAVVSDVNAGDGDDNYIGGAEVVTVASGVATVTLENTAVETFTVAIDNSAGLTDPSDDSINVTVGAATEVVITAAGVDFDTDGSTSLSVAVRDADGNIVTTDSTTQITFTPSGSAVVSDVTTGDGDDTYNTGAETVTVASGLATVTLQDSKVETFTVEITDNASLTDPADDSINVTIGAPNKVAITSEGANFATDGSTTLTVAVQDAGGNTVLADNTTNVTFTTSGSAVISDVNTGTGDDTYNSSSEIVTVDSGVATITLVDTKVETFTVAIDNSASLIDPSNDSIDVSVGPATQVVITNEGADFTTDGNTSLTAAVQDAGGNTVTTDVSTNLTFTTTGFAVISAVTAGDGDDTYGSNSEIVTVDGGIATITLVDPKVETFTVAIDDDASLIDPTDDSIDVTVGAANKVVITSAGDDFATDSTTSLSVAVQDINSNTVTTDFTTLITFTPTNSAVVSDVTTGDGDDTYGTGAEIVTVVAGVATVTLADTKVETFTVAIDSGGLNDPSDDSINVTIGPATQVVLVTPGTDFTAGGDTDITLHVQDAGGNTVTADSSTVLTIDPSSGGKVTAVVTGSGDDTYGVADASEDVTVSSGVVTVTVSNDLVETFNVAFTNADGYTNPGADSIESMNTTPTLTTVSDFSAAEDAPRTITYAQMDAAANANDADGDTIEYQLVAKTNGTLTDGVSTVNVGDRLSSGEQWVWQGSSNYNGSNRQGFTIKAYDGHITSATAIPVRFDIVPDPSSPTASGSSTSAIYVDWNSGGGTTTDFRMAYKTGGTAPVDCASDNTIGEGSISGTDHTVGSLSSATSYSFRVCAINSSGDATGGRTVSGVYVSAGEISNLNSSNVTDTTVDLSWTTGGGATSDYKIIYKPALTPSSCNDGTSGGTPSSTSHTVTNLNPLTNYTFRVCARNPNGVMTTGLTVTVHTGEPPAWERLTKLGPAPKAYHMCGLTTANNAFCWGRNSTGGLGHGGSGNMSEPEPVDMTNVTPGEKFVDIALANHSTCAVTNAGDPYCWGQDEYGNLGDGGGDSDKNKPVAVDRTIVPPGEVFLKIAAGDGHACGVTDAGAAYCWGRNQYGQVGDNTTTNRFSAVAVNMTNVTPGETFVAITAGDAHTCALTNMGDAYCWGEGVHGELGENATANRSIPVLVDKTNLPGGDYFEHISVGGAFSCAITNAGAAFCWGEGVDGQIGDGSNNQRNRPTAVDTVNLVGGEIFVRTASGDHYNCGVTDLGNAYCWGEDNHGQLGDNFSISNRNEPARVVMTHVPSGVGFTEIAAGHDQTCATTDNNLAYCWGENIYGASGMGQTGSDQLIPVPVSTDNL